jgi:hypothetical protein
VRVFVHSVEWVHMEVRKNNCAVVPLFNKIMKKRIALLICLV